MEIAEDIGLLTSKNNQAAYQALKRLQAQSEEDAGVYQYFDHLAALLEHVNSYVRTRGIILIADNIRWDNQGRFDAIAEIFCGHILDAKPITARQCVKALSRIIPYKPTLWPMLEEALRSADFSVYPATMQPLLEKDRREALNVIQAQKQNSVEDEKREP